MRAVTADRTIVDSWIPAEGAARIAALAGLAIVGSLLLWASAKINVPFWPVKMSMQTFVVMALAAAYGPRLGVATVLLYLAEGAFGLPVFQGTPDRGLGLAYMAGPTGGYLLGFVAATFVIGALTAAGGRDLPRLFGIMLLGDAIMFALGFAWLAWFAVLPNGATGIGMAAAFAGGVAPFILGDIVKVALATCVAAAALRLVRR
jgi:biotin transport system substrate-specific component